MLPLAAQPLAHCSATRIRSRVGFGSRSKLPTPKNVPPNPASSEQPVGERRRPGRLRHVQRAAEDADRLGRHARGSESAGRGARARPAERLRVPEAADLVARRHLPRDPAARVLEGPVGILARRLIRRVQPLRGVAGVQVVVDVRALLRAAAGVRVDEVPQPVADDRAADRRREVVDPAERCAAVTPWRFSAAVRLSDCSRPPLPPARKDPWVVLPPLFGTMFMTSPAVSASPSAPDFENVTSSALPMSTT